MELKFLDGGCDVFINESEIRPKERIESEIRPKERIESERSKKIPSFQSKMMIQCNLL